MIMGTKKVTPDMKPAGFHFLFINVVLGSESRVL